MIIDGGEDPVSDPNPSEDGDFDCKTAKGGNCLEVTVWGLVAYDGLIDAINNSETHVYFSDPEEPYFDIFSDSAFLYFLPQLQTGDLIMIKANNDAFCVVNNTYDPIETGWNEDSILFAYPYEFE
ncbi:MAG: hypothetical protein HYZ16_05980 [Bacteroidetes bacterium]|nr:hypothetical protein [Bacteroidota bacterium]